MNQPRTGGTTTDKEMVTMAEEELARLHRQFRIMEEDRVAFSDETRSKLEKQRGIIQSLRNEKQKVLEDITVATCANQKRKDLKLTNHIYKLLEDYDRYCRLVEEEKDNMGELEVQIKKLEQQIRTLRPKSAVTDEVYQNRLTSGQQAIKTLQNRLDNAVKKFCSLLTENKNLRDDIDHLLKEMNHYNLVWEKLIKDFNSGKKYMVDLIEQATLAFDQREEWCSKLEALKKRAQYDFIAHSEEMREVQRQLDHDLTLREFLIVKGQRRILRDLEEKERKKKEFEAQNLENQLRLYEDTLTQIKRFCQEEDIQRIASQFVKQEEENFALFNYVNELNHEIESLNATLTDLKEKIDEQVELSQVRAKERQATVKSLEYDLSEATKKADVDEDAVRAAKKELEDVLSGIEDIFTILSCDKAPILELLGDSSGINLYNMKIYLGTIEKRLSALITKVYFAEKAMLTQTKKFQQENITDCI
ncbi:coiled-coil domain-containing protein 63-like [Anoplophora glabripennis]|uniref:coiled-coil domain-containing protein 63-like n=1 Tax=Anoplophora glabripennis TaxID=217634 RepID=UPI0008737B4C|nr:coiled-coil domain-containing protein 63-like [Anoplophora glabripennis]